MQLGWHLIKKKWPNTTFLLGLIDDLEKGDTFATLMGWLDDVDAGGGTVFADGEVVKVTTIHSTITIFTTKICEKMSIQYSSIWCRDSNSRPLEHEPPPITTRPGLPSSFTQLFPKYSLIPSPLK